MRIEQRLVDEQRERVLRRTGRGADQEPTKNGLRPLRCVSEICATRNTIVGTVPEDGSMRVARRSHRSGSPGASRCRRATPNTAARAGSRILT
jgi:hypothetical protein